MSINVNGIPDCTSCLKVDVCRYFDFLMQFEDSEFDAHSPLVVSCRAFTNGAPAQAEAERMTWASLEAQFVRPTSKEPESDGGG